MEDAVLLVAGAQTREQAARVLASGGITSVLGQDGAALGAQLRAGVGALLVVEEALRGEVLDVLLEHVNAQPAWSDLPILVMTRRGTDSADAHRAFDRLGNVTLLERPVRTMTLVSAVRSALRGRKRQYEVRALNERKDQMLATLAHELRNPLAPIRSVAEVLRRRFPTPEVGKMLAIVERQVSHLTRLVDDLLDVARINSGKLELRKALTTSADIVLHAVEIAEGAMAERSHQLVVHQPDEPLRLLADHVRLVQSVANLLVNAAKFTEPGGRISLEVRPHGEQVEFVVRDSGRGIAPQDLDSIFEMFRQSRRPGEPSVGLGLGLHLTRAFAELHGGNARAESEGLGHGSVFTLSVPAARDVPPAQLAAAVATSPALPGRVLVVDDNVDAASTLQALLVLAGMEVAVEHDGQAAVAHAVRERFDAVVMDIGMPVMNGYDAARELRRRLGDATPMLVAVTGWGQYADKALASDAGFDCHFVKPLVIADLLACLAARPAAVQAERCTSPSSVDTACQPR